MQLTELILLSGTSAEFEPSHQPSHPPPRENPLCWSHFCSVSHLPYVVRKNSQQPPPSLFDEEPVFLARPLFCSVDSSVRRKHIPAGSFLLSPCHSIHPGTPQSLPKRSWREKLLPLNDWRLFSCSDLTPGPLWRASRGQCSTMGGLAVLKANQLIDDVGVCFSAMRFGLNSSLNLWTLEQRDAVLWHLWLKVLVQFLIQTLLKCCFLLIFRR